MPISTTNLEKQFNSLSTDEQVAVKIPALVTPIKAEQGTNDSVASDDCSCSYGSPAIASPSSPETSVIQKTDHKLKEERGELAPEPLLVENPHRFVIFPIKDNDVSY